MNIENLRYFIAVAEAESLHKASDALNITQPALSKAIRHLEAEMGVALFTRSARGMVLTDAGQVMLERAVPLYQQWARLRDDVLSTVYQAPVKLGALPSLAAYYLPRRMTNLPPSVKFGGLAVYSTTEDGLAALAAGELDALVAQAGPETPTYWQRDLFTEPYCVLTSADHPLATATALTLAEVSHYPLTMHPPGCDVRSAVTHAYQQNGLTCDIALEVPFNESIMGFVAAGVGIAIVPKLMGDQAIRLGLAAIPVADETLSRRIVLTARQAAVGRSLVDWLHADTPRIHTVPDG